MKRLIRYVIINLIFDFMLISYLVNVIIKSLKALFN